LSHREPGTYTVFPITLLIVWVTDWVIVNLVLTLYSPSHYSLSEWLIESSWTWYLHCIPHHITHCLSDWLSHREPGTYTVFPITLLMLTLRSNCDRLTANITNVSQELDGLGTAVPDTRLLFLGVSDGVTLALCLDKGLVIGALPESLLTMSVGDWGADIDPDKENPFYLFLVDEVTMYVQSCIIRLCTLPFRGRLHCEKNVSLCKFGINRKINHSSFQQWKKN
jgi:hypothetical protein